MPGATLHVGWFEDTLPKFLVDRTGHDFEYVAYNALHEQVLVRLTS